MSELVTSRFFPPAESANQDGLICVGGELSPEWLLDAYRHGIFPWPLFDDVPMAWWSLDPRAIFEFDQFYISRRLARRIRSGTFHVTRDADFAAVIRGCSAVPDRIGATWLTEEMIDAYCELHELGYAHSVEAWRGDELAGGVYGVAIGGFFAAESMFYRVTDASKVALAALLAHLEKRGFRLVDIQQLTDHTARLGAVEIARSEYLRRLGGALRRPVEF